MLGDTDLRPAKLHDASDGDTARCRHADEHVRVRRRRTRSPTGLRRADRPYSGGRHDRRAGLAEPAGKRGRDRFHRGVGVGPFGRDFHFVSVADLEAHHRDDALGVGFAAAEPQTHVRVERARERRQHRRRPGMQTGRIGHANRLRHDEAARRARIGPGGAVDMHAKNHVLAGAYRPVRGFEPYGAVASGHDDLRQQALGVCRDEVGIELDQRVAGADGVPDGDARREALPFSATVSRPMCMSTSMPASVAMVTAWPARCS